MSLLLHAITTRSEAFVAGLHGRGLATSNVGVMTAWYTPLPTDRASFTKADVLDHHRVVSQVFETVEACLPARFPTVVADEDVLRSQLAERGEALAAQLEVVRGACELAVTALWTAPEAAEQNEVEDLETVTPGRRYLLRRASSQRRRRLADELADSLEQRAGRDVLQARRQVCPSMRVALSLALLLRRASADIVRARLDRDLNGDVRILVSGPWAPYTFADARPTKSRER